MLDLLEEGEGVAEGKSGMSSREGLGATEGSLLGAGVGLGGVSGVGLGVESALAIGRRVGAATSISPEPLLSVSELCVSG